MRITLSILLFGALSAAQQLVEEISFGQSGKISPNGYGIPHWHVSGEVQVPQLLTDKVVLTPPYPGSARGALWAENPLTQSRWTAELEFRASGPERGSGNLQLWYAKDGLKSVSTSSLYTVGNFDGMVLAIDQYGSRGGTIRGFMNDGSTDYKTHVAVDSLAFGHCDYAYRNLGRPSKLQVRQEAELFEVLIDGRQCFSSDKIRLPTEYSFGITGASGETPDSFEVNRFQLWGSDPVTPPPSQQEQRPVVHHPADAQASTFQSSEAQFEDLHNRLQTLAHAIERLDTAISQTQETQERHHNEVSRGLMTRQTIDHIITQTDKLDRIEKTIDALSSRLSNLHGAVTDSHTTFSETIPKHMSDIITTHGPRMGLLISMFVVIQIVLVGGYALYKRRSKQGPKKYL